MDSETCGECHKDIYEQWKSSMHHFASFNNQFYRKSIEYMQSVVGHAAEQVVRGLPRSRGVLQRTLRPADQGADRHAGGAGPVWRARRATRSRRWTAAWATAASRSSIRRCTSWRSSQQSIHPEPRSVSDLSESGAAPPLVHEAVHAAGLGGVLRDVPQGAPRRAGERLPVVPRVQRLRQLAGERRVGAGRAIVLLPARKRRRASTAT